MALLVHCFIHIKGVEVISMKGLASFTTAKLNSVMQQK